MQDTAPKSFVKNRITSPINEKTLIAKIHNQPLAFGASGQPQPQLKNTRQSLPFCACIYKMPGCHFHHGFPLFSLTNAVQASGLPDLCNGFGGRVAGW
jgi:hypothetical protein